MEVGRAQVLGAEPGRVMRLRHWCAVLSRREIPGRLPTCTIASSPLARYGGSAASTAASMRENPELSYRAGEGGEGRGRGRAVLLIHQLAGPTVTVKTWQHLVGEILGKSGVLGLHSACRPQVLVSPCSTS